jgi:hypothetical protein
MSDTEVDGTPDEVEQREDSLVPYSTDEHHAAGWLRSALIVVPLVLGLLLVAAIGARMLTAEIPDRGPGATNEQAPERCWDGALKPDEGCPIPSGRAGLRWVFPSFRPSEIGCRDARADFPRSTRPAMFSCAGTVEAGDVTILYSQLTQVDRGRSSFEKTYGDAEELDDELGKRLLWREGDDPGADGDYDLAVMYAALPFAVELSAASPKALSQALESLVRFRNADDVMDHS